MQDSPATTASRYEEQRINSELRQRQDNTSWMLFGGADTGRYRDLEESGLQKYEGFGGQLGLRYPLLGAMQARRAAVIDTQIALDQAEHSTELILAEQQQELRQTYIDWWQQGALTDWCNTYQPVASSEQKAVANRTQVQQLRLSEKLWVEQHWRRLTRVCTNLAQQDAHFRGQLAYLQGEIISAAAKPIAEKLPTRLAPIGSWLHILEKHPALKTHRAEQYRLEPLAQSRWTDRIDADFSISQRYDNRDGMSGSGGGTVAAITFEVPIGSLSGGNRGNSAESRYIAARYRTEDTRHNLMKVLEQTLMQYQQRLDYLKERSIELKRTQQLVLEQKGRLNIDTEVGFLNLRLAQLEQAEVEQELINAWHATWSVLAQLQVLTDGEPLTRSTDAMHWSSLQEYQNRIDAEQSLSAVSTEIPGSSESAKSVQSWSTAAYIWDTSVLLDREQRAEQVESLARAGFNHVYLGFNAAQVSNIESLNLEITQLIHKLKQSGFTVDLLLGDPQWLLKEQRSDLLQLIDTFSALPFDNLHLDLEVEQLGWPVPESRLHDWLQTLEAASQRSPWPVTLVSHHRWFAAQQRFANVCVPCALPGLNIESVTLMLYSTAEQSVITRTAKMLDAWPELQLYLAQSVETDLPKENSWSGSSPAELTKLTIRLRDHLKPRGLAGVAWQDWAQYPRSATEKY
ncbi:TolC family protein [Pseudomonas sp. C27(2019)]|uniref:TolC family protein n=1 Tax=Pseudomonas sp. C27(2019) TaxID=2604941 RepID=UPI001244B902|nr:TolC family protein [Pseudomonas sp. C27(2019)]QEY60194.1 TolC family protein [Pseudomonas sp. C27(2019)]